MQRLFALLICYFVFKLQQSFFHVLVPQGVDHRVQKGRHHSVENSHNPVHSLLGAWSQVNENTGNKEITILESDEGNMKIWRKWWLCIKEIPKPSERVLGSLYDWSSSRILLFKLNILFEHWLNIKQWVGVFKRSVGVGMLHREREWHK